MLIVAKRAIQKRFVLFGKGNKGGKPKKEKGERKRILHPLHIRMMRVWYQQWIDVWILWQKRPNAIELMYLQKGKEEAALGNGIEQGYYIMNF